VSYYAKFEDDQEEVLWKSKDGDKAPKWYDFLFGFRTRDRTAKDVPCSYNWSKAIVYIVQTVFGVFTLYRTRGDQAERFGYAAYGLTVTPYAMMSIVNLAGNLLRPSYPAMYIVGSKSSDDFQKRYKCTIATVGRVKEPNSHCGKDTRKSLLNGRVQILGLVIGLTINLLVIGLLTRFKKGQSTLAQRVWIMVWFVLGAFCRLVVYAIAIGIHTIGQSRNVTSSKNEPPHEKKPPHENELPHKNEPPHGKVNTNRPIEVLESRLEIWISQVTAFLFVLIPGVPTIGGFVVVAQMIRQYGVCSRILDAGV
jgi:hypothetical protein